MSRWIATSSVDGGAPQQKMCLLGKNDVSDRWLPDLRCDLHISPFKDLTDVVERDSEYHIGIGEHSDLWRGNLEVDGVPTLVRPSLFHVCFHSWWITGCHQSSSRRLG